MKNNPYFYEDKLRLRVYNIEGNFFFKTMEAIRKYRKNSQPRPGVKTLTREQNKQTIHLFLNVQNRLNEKR